MDRQTLKRLANSRALLWLLLSLPAAAAVRAYATDAITYGEFIQASGDWSVRLLIATMAVTPIRLLLAGSRWPAWLLARRRHLGVATFGYALLHTIAYLVRKADFDLIAAEGADPSLWTGWLAFFIFAALAVTSNNASVRLLASRWKQLHRLVYAAAILTFAHWLLSAFDIVPGLIYAGILATIEVVRMLLLRRRAHRRGSPA